MENSKKIQDIICETKKHLQEKGYRCCDDEDYEWDDDSVDDKAFSIYTASYDKFNCVRLCFPLQNNRQLIQEFIKRGWKEG